MTALLAATVAFASLQNPMVVAHRGSSGYLPEHTLPAYALAYGQGADLIEPDVVLTRDAVPICLHDIGLGRTTNVEEVFPNRAREDGNYYAADFTLEEIKSLTVDAGNHSRPDAPAVAKGLTVPTLEEMVSLVSALNASTGGAVGIIPELKQTAFHEENDLDLVAASIEVLDESADADMAVYIQSFEFEPLQRIAELDTRYQLVYLVSFPSAIDAVGGLESIAETVQVFSPNKGLIEATEGQLVRDAQAAGLMVIPWTFYADIDEMIRFYREYGVDGLFTDFPDQGVVARDQATGE